MVGMIKQKEQDLQRLIRAQQLQKPKDMRQAAYDGKEKKEES